MMRRDVLGQVQKAFAQDKDQIYLAIHIIHEIVNYTKQNGLIVLSKYMGDREEDQPYVLDLIADEKQWDIPLRQYLEFGLELLSEGSEPEKIEELLSNKYFANAYKEKEAVIAYIYMLGLQGVIEGRPFFETLEYYCSFVPDDEMERFETFCAQTLTA